MIVSHRHKFIFIKTNKTAGTSIEIALSRFCGPNDIITPVSEEDEAIRQKLGYPGPQNYLLPFSNYNLNDLTRLLLKRKKKKFYNHISARLARSMLGERIWENYYKFCVERNPWDRCISLYYWRNKSEKRRCLAEFVASKALLSLKKRGYELYTIDGKIVVDRICRYENISCELEQVRKLLGIPQNIVLPNAKAKFRKDRRNYRKLLGEDEKARIAQLFREEIKLLGYKF